MTITFYKQTYGIEPELKQRNIVNDQEAYSIKFNLCMLHKFGSPNDEALDGHPYYKLGLRSYSFYELQDSDLIEQTKKIVSVHPYYNAERWSSFKHYIITFHDSMFECIAKDFEISEANFSLYKQASILLNEIAADHM